MAISDLSNEVVVKTITRWINEIQSSTNAEYQLLFDTTLNHKYSIYPTQQPTSVPKILYFGLGLNGFYNVDDGNMSAPYRPTADELDLYEPIPMRCVPVDEDLSPDARANYRMRRRETINGQDYYCYYLKKLTLNDTTVRLVRTNPITKEEEPYELSEGMLTPVPSIPSVSGEVSGTMNEVNATLSLGLSWLGSEVLEAINIKYNGDMRRAKISEIGIYSGEDATVTGFDASGASFSYVESIYTQLAYKICNIGSVITSPSYDGSRSLILNNSSNLLF